jgi:hypothetical protein
MYMRIILVWILGLTATLTLAQQLNNPFDFKYGDSIQLVTVDSFWFKGMYVNQNDSMLILHKPYSDNFTVLKREIAYIKVNGQKLHKVSNGQLYPEPTDITTTPKDTTTPVSPRRAALPTSPNKPRLSVIYPNGVSKEEEIRQKIKAPSNDISDLYTGNYFFSGSAIQLPKGEGYYKGYYALFHTVNYSFTDYFSLGAGTELYTLLTGLPMVMLQGKLTTRLGDNTYIGGSYMFFKIFTPLSNSTPIEPIHITTGIFTIGSTNANISFNAGARVGSLVQPTLAISGYYEPSEDVALISENILIPIDQNTYYPLYSLGVRWLSNYDVTWEAALYSNKEIFYSFIGIPYTSAIFKF